MKYQHNFCFLCKSYIGDFEYAERLIRSFNEYNMNNLKFYLCVPSEDVSMFRKLSSDTIEVLDETTFDFHFVSDDRILGIRPGYINQEIVKLSFWRTHLALNYFCIDSDSEFIRPFFLKDFMFSEEVPFSVLVEDHELAVDPFYYETYWKSRAKYLEEIKKTLDYSDIRTLTCHNNTTMNSLVHQSLQFDFLEPRQMNYHDLLKIAPYEFSWYNVWLQKSCIIPILPREPFFKMFHTEIQLLNYYQRGITKMDMARAYLGIVVNSNFSRHHGVLNYEDAFSFRLLVLRRRLRNLKDKLLRLFKVLGINVVTNGSEVTPQRMIG